MNAPDGNCLIEFKVCVVNTSTSGMGVEVFKSNCEIEKRLFANSGLAFTCAVARYKETSYFLDRWSTCFSKVGIR